MNEVPVGSTVAANKHVLILDDNADICALISVWLRSLGYIVATAQGGRDFLRAPLAGAPDVLITDILMPDGDGFEVIEAARAARLGTKIIAISGGGTYLPGMEYLKLAKSIGADAVLTKPFTQRQVVEAVNQVLS
jgi:CheY-like chemotaxis protein